jgi:hypothetical protein
MKSILSNSAKKQNSDVINLIKTLSESTQQLRISSDKNKVTLDTIKDNLNDIRKRLGDYSNKS